jgi:hypothetical protein
MNAKKQRERNRRRANKLACQAWQAADDGRPDLALKIIRRAVDLNPANPALWHDQAALLVLSQEDDQAAKSFLAALQLAPEFADAYAGLAAIRGRQRKLAEAVTLQREAVRHARHPERHERLLAAFEALLMAGCGSDSNAVPEKQGGLTDAPVERTTSEAWLELAATIERLNWPEIEGRLTGRGLAHVPQLLSAERCETLRTLFDDDRLFSKTVTMNKDRFGRGVYRYFAAPIPPLVDAIRQRVYPHLAEIANRWQRLLRRDDQYPTTWSALRDRCIAAGQTTPSPLLLRYETGGFNAPHRDIRGDIFFPVQLVVVLSSRNDCLLSDSNAFAGGEFLFCDEPDRKPSDRCTVSAGLGDAVLFCTQARLVPVGGVYGLKPVKHGLNRITAGSRYALGVPFHDFR